MSSYALAREILHDLYPDIVLTPEQDARALGLLQRWIERLNPRPAHVTARASAARLGLWTLISMIVMFVSTVLVYTLFPRTVEVPLALIAVLPVAPNFTQELIDLGPDRVLEHPIPTDMRARFDKGIDIIDVSQYENRLFVHVQLPDTLEYWVVAYEWTGETWVYLGAHCQSCGIVRP